MTGVQRALTLWAVLIGGPVASWSQTPPVTPNVGLYLPPHGSYNWDTYANANSQNIDKYLSGLLVLPGLSTGRLSFVSGSLTVPAVNRTFINPLAGGTIYDASPLTSNPLAQGDGSYAPIFSVRVYETGGATAAPIYTEYHAGPGATGGAYGTSTNVSADPGSVPAVVANNPTIQDASHVWLNGCTRSSGVATCGVYSGTGSVPLSLQSSGSSLQCFYITGTSDTSFSAGGAVQCPSSWSATSVTFANAGANVSSGVTGGWISPTHQFFGNELNVNNASHDPGHIVPSGGPLPVWGSVVQPTPFTWTNPTGAASIINLPLSADYVAFSGSNPAQTGNAYNGFVAQDAIDDLFLGGMPQTGGAASTAKSAFRARPIAIAVTGTNYPSQKSCWDASISNGSGGANDATYCLQYVPNDATANTPAHFEFSANGFPSIKMYRDGNITAQSGSGSLVTYGFNGYTNGIFNNAGVTSANGAFEAPSFRAAGSAGYSGTKTAGTCVFTITGGIITAVTGC